MSDISTSRRLQTCLLVIIWSSFNVGSIMITRWDFTTLTQLHLFNIG